MKRTLSTWTLLFLLIQTLLGQRISGPVQVHPDQRYFMTAEGEPFFRMADTA
jgi:hypothetical protein